MKKNIHPQLNNNCQVSCVCGNSFTTVSTKDSISLEICGNCHPFYTGQQKFVDTEGQIDKFKKRTKVASELKEKHKDSKKVKKKAGKTVAARGVRAKAAARAKGTKTKTVARTPKKESLKDMMDKARKS